MNKLIAMRNYQIYLSKLMRVLSDIPDGLEDTRNGIEVALAVGNQKSEDILNSLSMKEFENKAFFVSDLIALAGIATNEEFYHNEDELNLNSFRMMQELLPSAKQEEVFVYSLYPEQDDISKIIEASVIVANGYFILNVVSDVANTAGVSFKGKNVDALEVFKKALNPGY